MPRTTASTASGRFTPRCSGRATRWLAAPWRGSCGRRGCAGSAGRRVPAPRSPGSARTSGRTWFSGRSPRPHQTSCGSRTSPTAGASPVGSTPRSCSTCSPAGWSVGQLSRSWRTDLALDVLEMRLWTRRRQGRTTSGLIHHSDKGVQYVAVRYTQERDRPPRTRRRRIPRLVQPPTPPQRDRRHPTRRVRGRLLPSQPGTGYRRRVTSESPLNPARDTAARRKARRGPQILDGRHQVYRIGGRPVAVSRRTVRQRIGRRAPQSLVRPSRSPANHSGSGWTRRARSTVISAHART